MKRRWILILLAGLAAGIVAGFGLALWLLAPLPEPKRAVVLENVHFQELAAKAGQAKWDIVSDGPVTEDGSWYFLGPWKGQSALLSRTTLARAQLTAPQRKEFISRVAAEIRQIIVDRGARAERKTNGTSMVVDGIHSDWFEQHYSYGGMHGVVHLLVTGEGDRVICWVTMAEVRATAESWPVGDIPLFRRASGGP